MKVSATLTDARILLGRVEQNLSQLRSLDGARNPDFSLGEVISVLNNIDRLRGKLSPLLDHFSGQMTKQNVKKKQATR